MSKVFYLKKHIPLTINNLNTLKDRFDPVLLQHKYHIKGYHLIIKLLCIDELVLILIDVEEISNLPILISQWFNRKRITHSLL